MMLSGFLFLLLLTGESTSSYSEQPELRDDQQKFSYSLEESGSTSNYPEQLELQQNFSQSPEDDEKSSNSSCSDRDLVMHLNLTKNNAKAMTRPGDKSPTRVILDVVLYAILDVQEKDQKCVPYIWVDTIWWENYIYWNPNDFCGIEKIYIPTEVLWKPDLAIEEMTEKDKAPLSPYLSITNNGRVVFRNDMVVISTCKMQVYKFPFDIQSCTLTFKSVMHSVNAIQFENLLNSSQATKWSHELIRTQSEWLFINMTVSNKTVDNFVFTQSILIYTITMKRQSLLYIANFLLPILFFFCLDLASFLISDTGGEKVGFKVTVLLAVTVMHLILNEILPSSSDRIPLIAVYCIGIFGLMMLSLMEAILVKYLLEKDSASQDNEADKDQSLSEDCGVKHRKVSFHNCFREVKKLHCACICDVSPGETPSERLAVAKEGRSSQVTEESHESEKFSDELREVEKTLTSLLSSRKEETKPGYWTRVTKTINVVFFIFYIIAASEFLLSMFIIWNTAENNSANNSDD